MQWHTPTTLMEEVTFVRNHVGQKDAKARRIPYAKNLKSRSGATARRRPTVPISVFMTLGTEVHQQIFQSGGQSDQKPTVLSFQGSLALIYRPTE
ncbi:hypothetical protein TNCV_3585581 [Trichonephila clavipes]|nr:hypothetical protein TNCV_3585581 [Trichonephila clavipes]